MPVPDELKKTTYREVGQYDMDIRVTRAPFKPNSPNIDQPRRTTTGKTFHAYLELDYQSKHDKKIQAYCKEHDIGRRDTDGAQVQRPTTDDPQDIFAFYVGKGEIASEAVAEHMRQKWANNRGNNTVFVRGQKNSQGFQRQTQSDGYGYDISFWYYSHEIYVAFHCYPK
jgi:hypothetical protein